MNKNELHKLEQILIDEVKKRQALGGYSAEAEGLFKLTACCLAIVQHLEPKPTKKKIKKKK